MKNLFFLLPIFLLAACEPTYKQANFREQIKELAQKEYGLDVEVERSGKTLGIRYRVKNLIGEMYSGNEKIYKQVGGLFMILSRVALSSDVPPEFIVLDIVDQENPAFQLVLTRYVEDLRKWMAEALSFTQSQDRLLQEFVIGGKKVSMDASELDLVRLAMLAMEANSAQVPPRKPLEDVRFEEFLSRVTENTVRHYIREENDMKQKIQLRGIRAGEKDFLHPQKHGTFRVLLDIVSLPRASIKPGFLESVVLRQAGEQVLDVLKSYRFSGYHQIEIIEKNTGKMLTLTTN